MRSARWGEKLVALCMLALPLGGGAPAPADSTDARGVAATRPMLWPPFQHAPLDGPLIVTGSFGEYRPGRFHAGLDLATGEEVGKPVYAPLDGWIERVRTSGVGYGRSIYLHAADGRMVLLGHLDAFDEPLASYVSAAQDSSGQYEQDLWPEAARFKVSAGQRLGWSGRSGGVGQPHLHLEIRRGDMAINPLLAGASVEDSTPPAINAIALDPRTADSRVNGGRGVVRWTPGVRAETLRVAGAARVEVEARDSGLRRADMQPYEVEMRWRDQVVRCAFDSLSWATDMPEGPLIYDPGRRIEERRHALSLWAPAGFRPRALTADRPLAEEVGVLQPASGIPSAAEGELLPVTITTRDLSGREASARFVVRFETAAPPPPSGRECGEFSGRRGAFSWRLAPASCYGAGTGWDSLRAESLGVAAPAGDLAPVGRRLAITPRWLALRQPVEVGVALPAGRPLRRLGLYVRGNGDWELLSTEGDSVRWIAHPTHLGEFSLFEDRVAPHVTPLKPPHSRSSASPYSRWALEARIEEQGSGVNARASGFTVDGRRRPTEWDAVDRKLRWKPRTPPSAGTHRYSVIAVDKAGNQRRVSGTFVIN